MSSTNTPNMGLIVPGVGSEQGPDYAIEINNDLSIVDVHDHSPGSGVPITPSGLNVNAALTFNNQSATNLASITLTAQGSTPSTVSTIYQAGSDLYYIDALGNNIRITQSGGVAGTPGSISNLVSPATASYVALSQKFVWQSGTNIAADMDFGAAIMRNLSPNSTYALTLQPPLALSSNYTLTLPTIPAATSFLTIDNAGNILSSPALVGALTTSNLSATAGILGSQIASATISGSNIASATITGANIASTTIDSTKLANNTITSTQIANLGILDASINSVSASKVSGSLLYSVTSIASFSATYTNASFTTLISSGTITGSTTNRTYAVWVEASSGPAKFTGAVSSFVEFRILSSAEGGSGRFFCVPTDSSGVGYLPTTMCGIISVATASQTVTLAIKPATTSLTGASVGLILKVKELI